MSRSCWRMSHRGRSAALRLPSLVLTCITLSTMAGCIPVAPKVVIERTASLEHPVDVTDLQSWALTLQQELDSADFKLDVPRREPNEILRFVHVSDVQIREFSAISQSRLASKTTDKAIKGTERPRGIDTLEEYPFIALVNAVNRMSPRDKPDFLIHTGDAIEVGTRGEMLRFLSVANQLDVPWYSVIGNHDILTFGNFSQTRTDIRNYVTGFDMVTDRLTFMNLHGDDWFVKSLKEPYGLHRATHKAGARRDSLLPILPSSNLHGFDCDSMDPDMKVSGMGTVYSCRSRPSPYYSFTVQTSRHPNLRVVVLDTNAEDTQIPRLGKWQLTKKGADGFLREDQLSWLRAQISDAKVNGEAVLVFGHHPLSWMKGRSCRVVPTLRAESGAASRPQPLLAFLMRQENVLGYFGGHTHHQGLFTHYSIGRPNSRPFVEVIAPSMHEYPQTALLVRISKKQYDIFIDVAPLTPTPKENSTESAIYQKLIVAQAGAIENRRASLAGRCAREEAGEGIENDTSDKQDRVESSNGPLGVRNETVEAVENEPPRDGDPFNGSQKQDGMKPLSGIISYRVKSVNDLILREAPRPKPSVVIAPSDSPLVCPGRGKALALKLAGTPPFYVEWSDGSTTVFEQGAENLTGPLPSPKSPDEPEPDRMPRWIGKYEVFPKESRTRLEISRFSDRLTEGSKEGVANLTLVSTPPPVSPASLCDNQQVSLRADVDAGSYKWRFKGEKVPFGSGQEVMIRPSQLRPGPGARQLELQLNDCEWLEVPIPVFKAPKIKEKRAEFCERDEAAKIYIDVESETPFSVTWEDEKTTRHTGGGRIFREVSPALSKIYYIREIKDEHGCSATLNEGKVERIELSQVPRPVILSHPASVNVCEGDEARFEVEVKSERPVAYQWFKEGEGEVREGNGSSITISGDQTRKSASFYVEIRDNVCLTPTRSTMAVLNVQPKIEFKDVPPVRACAGDGATLEAKVENTTEPTFQWFRKGNKSPMAQTSSPYLVLSPDETREDATFLVKVSDGVCRDLEKEIVLQTIPRPGILQQPKSDHICPGKSAALRVVAADRGVGSFSYAWYRNNSDGSRELVGATDILQVQRQGDYYVEVKSDDTKCRTESEIATVTLRDLSDPLCAEGTPGR